MSKEIRITCVGAKQVQYTELKEFQGELKDLSKENYSKLKNEILTLGFTEPISVWEDQGNLWILNGHQRLRTIKQMVEEENYQCPGLPVSVVLAKDKEDASRKVLALTSQYGEITKEGLYKYSIEHGITPEEIEERFRFPEINLNSWKMNFFEDERVEEPLPAATAVPRTKLGDIYQLGSHRLMCGDSTDMESVNALMDGNMCDIAFTSPPYNLGNNAKLRGYNGDGKDSAYNEKSDHKSEEEYLDFLVKFTSNAMSKCKMVFVNIQILAGNKFVIPKYWGKFQENLVDLMIWDKEHAAPSMAAHVLNSVWEFIFIFSNEDRPSRSMKSGEYFRGTIDNIYRLNPIGKKDELAKSHGAVFPVEFCQHFISRFSDQSVLDLFGGSGSTLIACEKTNRKCFMMEIDPAYCDIIVERWEKFTGNKSELINIRNENSQVR